MIYFDNPSTKAYAPRLKIPESTEKCINSLKLHMPSMTDCLSHPPTSNPHQNITPSLSPPYVVAPHADHAGDGRFPGEAAGRPERQMHSAADARLPADAVQTGPPLGAPARGAHPDPAGDHQRPVAVHQDPPPAGPAREGVHQL